jgi:hypothetical protein
MCPLGALMEALLGAGDPSGRHAALYGYFKREATGSPCPG